MSNSAELMKRRQAVVADGVAIFNKATAVSGSGSILTDADGRQLIDFVTGIGVTALGHAPEPVVEAICDQSRKLIHSCFHIATYESYIQLCEKLASLFPHGPETKVMLTNTGAEAVENAIKIARQATKRHAVICYTDAFHGRSMMAMTLTSKIAYKFDCGPFAPEVYRTRFPNYYRYNDGLEIEDFVNRELQFLREKMVNTVDPKDVAAIIIEPVQGEGGFNPVPAKYLEGLRTLCDENGILLIVDEVQTGFCRTGKWGAYQHTDVVPDISTWAKAIASGMPLGAVVGKKSVMDAAKPGTIGGTYLGNPVACAASLATILYMEEHHLDEAAVRIGDKIRKKFNRLKGKCNAIGDVRGLGAMMAFELVKPGGGAPNPELCSRLVDACLARNLLIIGAGTHKNVIRVLCPLTISDNDLDKGLLIIEEELLRLSNV